MITLTGRRLAKFREPSIYVWTRGEEILYVGQSLNGIGRPCDPRHHKLWAIEPEDRVFIWRCRDGLESILESRLIEELKPTLNAFTPRQTPITQLSSRSNLKVVSDVNTQLQLVRELNRLHQEIHRLQRRVARLEGSHPKGPCPKFKSAPIVDMPFTQKSQPIRAMWSSIVSRCTNPSHKYFPWYGGRQKCLDCHLFYPGTKPTCDRCGSTNSARAPVLLLFKDIKELLAEPTMGSRKFTNDRIQRWPDLDGDFAPGNVRWWDKDSCNEINRNRTKVLKKKVKAA